MEKQKIYLCVRAIHRFYLHTARRPCAAAAAATCMEAIYLLLKAAAREDYNKC